MSTKKISFSEWLRIVWEHGGLLLFMNIGAVMFAAFAFFLVAPLAVGIPLFGGVGLAFLLALRYAWQRDCKNQPWWLKLYIGEGEDEQTDD